MKNSILAISILFFSNAVVSQPKVSIVPKPANILIERGENKQYINFDFLVTNHTNDTLTITKLMVSVFDNTNKLIHSRFLDNNGTAPSINLIPNRKFNSPSSYLIFNPFADFSLTMPLSKLIYEWTFSDNSENEIKINSVITPQKYNQKENFKFPLKGKVFVYDSHDLYSHHRRFDYDFEPIKALGISSNFMRYAYDFVILDIDNKQFNSDGKKDEDYFGFGKGVYSIGTGKVIYASNNHKDDKSFDIPGIANNPLELYGNCIAILHADKSVSIYGHLKQNSIKVKKEDAVQTQQLIGEIGVSGSSFFPHLHFELRTSIQNSAEGLPSYFSNVYLWEANLKSKLKSGLVETGNIIEAK
jgi:murein DD-endopeptidase MepM/ murein hydrolase activator NlpD